MVLHGYCKMTLVTLKATVTRLVTQQSWCKDEYVESGWLAGWLAQPSHKLDQSMILVPE